jgi:hypothetical protein
MLRNWMYNLLAVPALLCGMTSVALAQESYLDSIELAGQAITVEVGKSVTLDLGMSRRVDHVEIDAFGVGGNGMFEVVVDGQVKGTIHVPGQDPKYIVTIAEETRHFVLHHLSGNKARVTSFKVFFEQDDGGSHLPPSHQDAANISRNIINKMSSFQSKISADQFQTYILPIKVSAGHSYAIATASGDLSNRLAQSLRVVQVQFRKAKPFFDSCMNVDALFDLSVQSLELMYQLDEMMD